MQSFRVSCSKWLVTAGVGWSLSMAPGAAWAQGLPPGVEFSDEVRAELGSYVQSALGAFDVPGAAVAVISGGEVVYLGAFGVRDVVSQHPVDLETRFMIGSITKSMTATMTASLVDAGLLGWDDPATDYLPSLALSNSEWTPLVRIRDLLGHTSGVPRSDLPLYFDFLRPLALVEALGAMPTVAPPGQVYEYQNQAFSIGGFAVARAAGAHADDRSLSRTYRRLMQDRLFDPVGMARTTLDFGAALADANRASPHGYDPVAADVTPVPIGFERFALPVTPAGAVWSDIEDMARYLAMQVRDGVTLEGRRVVSADSLLETHSINAPHAENTGYGLGWIVIDTGGGKLITHDGGTTGFTARVLGLPALDWGVAILTNRSAAGAFQEAVSRYAVELSFGLPHTGDADLLASVAALEGVYAELLRVTSPVSPDAVASYTGEYERGVSVSQRGDFLVLRTLYGELPFRALPDYPDFFVAVGNVLAQLVAQFTTDEQGQVHLTLGLPDAAAEQLVQSFELARLSGASQGKNARRRARSLDVSALPRAMHQRREPWGLR